jgi:hypothetical protein
MPKIKMFVGKIEISVAGRILKIAKLRHEWFEFLDAPEKFIEEMRRAPVADIFTFLQETHVARPPLPFYKETVSASVLTFTTYDAWWKNLHFKVRNKARKAQKTGVALRFVKLDDDDFVRGVESIYNESPVRQGRPFWHYGKNFATIKNDLSSFPECTFFVGAYHQNELIGFMKLFQGENILRTVHIISKLAHRDKNVMDALIARAVEIGGEKKIAHLHYGDWAHRGLGIFRGKFGFEQHDCPRYFVALTTKGKFALNGNFHRTFKERLPQSWIDRYADAREKWYAWRHREKSAAKSAEKND